MKRVIQLIVILVLAIIIVHEVYFVNQEKGFRKILAKKSVGSDNVTDSVITSNRIHNPIFQNIRVGALVFYGRRRYVEILNCYLERNLIENGGILSEIIFIAKTRNELDLQYLATLVASHPGRYIQKNVTDLGWTYHAHYKGLNLDQYYFKIDDDIVYIHSNTFERMLEAKLQNPEILFVSANIINHPVLSPVHAQMRAIHNISMLANISNEDPYCAWKSINCLSLQHSSFIKHVKDETLDAYMFPHWDFNWKDAYPRWSINLILFQGQDVISVGPGDDEHQISIVIPKRRKKHSVAVGAALAVHFAYIPQRRNGMSGALETYFVEKYANISRAFCR